MSLIEKYNNTDNTERQKMFYDYLKKIGLQESSCRQYSMTHPKNETTLNIVYEVAKKLSLFEVVDLLQVQTIYAKIKETETNQKVNNALSATIFNYKKFLDYLETETINQDVEDEEISERQLDSPNIWLYAPGEGARKWEECQEKQLMLIGWDEIGDFKDYNSRKDIVDGLRIANGNVENQYINDSLAIWQFYNDVRPGDIVYVKKGVSLIVGRGIVKGKYVYDNSRYEYKNTRAIEWTHVGEWEYPKRLPMKTLTRINDYVDMTQRLKDLFFPVKTTEQKPFNIETVIEKIKKTGLLYEDNLIKRYVYSLMTKPFVILSGLAGSGKTQLALAFARVMCEDIDQQMCVVPVGADWTNREPLLGYPNALKQGEYVLPESRALQIVIRANRNPQKPYFLVLDEMNLSYVERYFADFLSAMESNQEIPLWDKNEDCDSEVPSSVALPKNLFIIGTINVDETTYMFSPKVLDRANVIEFKVSDDEMESFLNKDSNVNVKAADKECAIMGQKFVEKATTKQSNDKDVIKGILLNFFKQLKKANAEFGYRTATEIGRFISLALESMSEDEAVDAALVQKLLPKLHGSRKKIVSVTKELWKLCGCEDLDTLENPDPTIAKYKLTADKVLRMYNSALENGFTSFAEA